MRTVFLDTVGLLALWDEDDQWHPHAERAMTLLLQAPCLLVSSSLVALECGNAAARTPYRQQVVDFREELARNGHLLVPTRVDEDLAWANYRQGSAGQPGIVDHVSFLLMRRHQITQAFTNDRHFLAAGFEILF